MLNFPPSKKPRITITPSSSNPMNSGAINIFSPAPQQKYQKLKQTKLQILATVANSLLDAKNMEEDISVIVNDHPIT